MNGSRSISGLVLALVVVAAASCKEEEPPPTYPPAIESAGVTCADASEQDYQVVEQVEVTITDRDGDLLTDETKASINGLTMTLQDPDADDVYTWSPPGDWDPPMVCRGDFTVVVSVIDTEQHLVEQTLVVEK